MLGPHNDSTLEIREGKVETFSNITLYNYKV